MCGYAGGTQQTYVKYNESTIYCPQFFKRFPFEFLQIDSHTLSLIGACYKSSSCYLYLLEEVYW